MCVCPYTFVSVSALVFVCLNVYPCFCIVSLCVCVCVCVCVCACVCVCVCLAREVICICPRVYVCVCLSVSLCFAPEARLSSVQYRCNILPSPGFFIHVYHSVPNQTKKIITLKGPQTLSVEPHTTKES